MEEGKVGIEKLRIEKSPYSASVKLEQVYKLFLEVKEKLPDIRNYRSRKKRQQKRVELN
jgi:hypothetical protein